MPDDDQQSERGHRRRTGRRGEELAVEHLRRAGWEIVARNFTTEPGEIDIIASRPVERPAGTLIAFVEVKSRNSADALAPELSVTARKRNTITRVAKIFADRHGEPGMGYRFDVISVNFADEPASISHFEGAFDARGNPY